MGAPLPRSDRRIRARHLACCPASLVRPDGEQRSSFVHDLSESGVLLLVHTSKVAVGDRVALRLYLGEDAARPLPVSGRVVRAEELADSPPWRLRVAVRLDEPLRVGARDIESFRRRAARLGLAS